MICSHDINFRIDGATRKVMSVALYVWHWVSVGDFANVHGSLISTTPPTAVLLEHEIKGG